MHHRVNDTIENVVTASSVPANSKSCQTNKLEQEEQIRESNKLELVLSLPSPLTIHQ